jgi:enoyl-[acyl-carrier protein] reductase III
VVLGASSGFGAEIIRYFAAKGHPVCGVHLDRRSAADRIDSLKSDLNQQGNPVLLTNGNAAKDSVRDSVLTELSHTMKPEDTVGVFVHSLAFGTLQPYLGEPETSLNERQMNMTLDVMAHTLVYWSQALVSKGMLTTGGRIYAMTSEGASIVWPNYGAVSAAKAALEAHIRQLAVELAPLEVTANAICAGVTDTPALEKIPGSDALKTQARNRNPHQRLTTPRDVAQCIYALSQPGTAWMTGNTIRVDGGEGISG